MVCASRSVVLHIALWHCAYDSTHFEAPIFPCYIEFNQIEVLPKKLLHLAFSQWAFNLDIINSQQEDQVGRFFCPLNVPQCMQKLEIWIGKCEFLVQVMMLILFLTLKHIEESQIHMLVWLMSGRVIPFLFKGKMKFNLNI